MKREWLSQKIQSRGLTHQEAADLIGIERSYFTQIIGGKRRPSPDIAQKIGTTLGLDWTLFFNNKCGITPQINNISTSERRSVIPRRKESVPVKVERRVKGRRTG